VAFVPPAARHSRASGNPSHYHRRFEAERGIIMPDEIPTGETLMEAALRKRAGGRITVTWKNSWRWLSPLWGVNKSAV